MRDRRDDIFSSQHSCERQQPLHSELADDPDMHEILDMFTSELPERVDALATALAGGAHGDLRTLAHQLKGAGHGYGYPAISDAAASVESLSLAEEADLSSLAERVEELISVCRRAAAGACTPKPGGGQD